jgi:hypothetical protein
MLVYVVVDDLSPDFPLGVELDVFVRRENAELRRGGSRREPNSRAKLGIEERELEAGPRRASRESSIEGYALPRQGDTVR